MKKIVALVLALILALSTVTVATSAEVENTQTQESVSSDSPIEKLEIKPISIIEGTKGSYTLITDTQTGEEYGYFDYDPENAVEYTVTFKDGTVRSGRGRHIFYDGEYHYFYADTGQSYQNPWTVGNTYTATITLMDVSVEVPVTITKAPISKIEIEPITIIEETNGYFSTYYDEETGEEYEYYKYSVSDMMEYTIIWEDGTVTSDSGNIVDYDGETYYFETENDQSYQNQWTVGNTYSMTASFMGTTVEVPVTIIKAPIEKIEFEPISVIEQTNGYYTSHYDESTGEYHTYFDYSVWGRLKCTVIFEDGSTVDGTTGILYNGNYYRFDIEEEQSYENQWTAGNTYYITATLMGVAVQVPVTIEKSPIEKMEIKPVTILEGTRCNIYGHYYYYYYPEVEMEYTITFQDDTVISGSGEYIDYKGERYLIDTDTDQQSDDPWTASNTYYMTASLMGVTAQVPVIIEKRRLGDVFGDGEITVVDATSIQRCVAKSSELLLAQLEAADVDGDSDVSVLDATLVQRFVAKLIDEF